jgi:hypothetical protein
MSALGKTSIIARCWLTTSWVFGTDSTRIKLCGLITFRIPYSEIRDCVLYPAHNQLTLASKHEAWRTLHAGILTNAGRVWVLPCEDAQEFIAALRSHAPQVTVRQLREKTRCWEWPIKASSG